MRSIAHVGYSNFNTVYPFRNSEISVLYFLILTYLEEKSITFFTKCFLPFFITKSFKLLKQKIITYSTR